MTEPPSSKFRTRLRLAPLNPKTQDRDPRTAYVPDEAPRDALEVGERREVEHLAVAGHRVWEDVAGISD